MYLERVHAPSVGLAWEAGPVLPVDSTKSAKDTELG